MGRFYSEIIENVAKFYQFELADEITIKHMNVRAQELLPGPYKIYYKDDKGTIDVAFHWDSEEQKTWWILKWT